MKTLRCRYCKRSGFEWTLTPQGWRFAEPDGSVHDCRVTPSYKASTYRIKNKRR